MDIEFAGIAMPDVLQGALMSGAVMCLLLARRQGRAWSIASGFLWAWAYYVKIDAFFLGGVLLLAGLLGFVRWTDLVVAGGVAALSVGIELAAYGVAAGDPILRLHLDSAAANEMLAPGHDYRNLIAYPKSMFLVPYEAGLHYYLLIIALIIAIWTRSRAAFFLVGWCVLWQMWLTFGADPFSGFRIKPQVSRYLLSWEVPMCTLIGYALVYLWQRARPLAFAAALGMAVCAALFTPFNQLSFEGPEATQAALSEALKRGWFPLYPDSQSIFLLQFLLHGRPELQSIREVQSHDYQHGVTTFHPVTESPAYLLINEDYARRLEARSLVKPIDPTSFGLCPTLVYEVNNPLPSLDYASMRLLVAASSILPSPLRTSIQHTADDILRPDDAKIWRLDSCDRAEIRP